MFRVRQENIKDISNEKIIDIAFSLVEYYDSLRVEKRYEEADNVRTYLESLDFRITNLKDNWKCKFSYWNSWKPFDNLRDRIEIDTKEFADV